MLKRPRMTARPVVNPRCERPGRLPIFLVGVAVACAACASSLEAGPVPDEVYTNPPPCAATAAAHHADPTLPVHVEARLNRVAIPDRETGPGQATIRVTVLETGFVDRDSIVVEGDVSTEVRTRLGETAARWRFQPARVGDCWVASTYSWQYTG